MQLSTESLLIILAVGAIAGWIAGQIVRGYGFGLLGNIAVGIVGALIGSWLLPQIGILLGTGIVASIVNATLGAIVLLLILGAFRRGGGGFLRR
ncbi:MAG: GlsB/YeaQ/YmgE family stress response membrane protein [Devosia sp.]